jgi:xanthine dehydrogenase accessory factor
MNSIDMDVMTTVDAWIDGGLACELVTIVQTWGSSPRPQGSMMAIRADGIVVGSVSGGCIEDDLIERARRGPGFSRIPELITYGILAEDAHRFGLPCGGTIRLVCEPLGPGSGIKDVLARLHGNRLVARSLNLESGEVEVNEAAPGQALELSHGVLTNTFGPRWRLIVIGAGPLSQFLAQVATGLDYQVIVCDPREEHRASWNVPGVEVMHAMPDDLVLELKLDSRSAVVALTHDPKLDDLALMEALRSEAFYVGAIGSRLNTARRRERLLQFDVSAAQLDRLHAPIGLFIGSKTPPEIAISILAQLTAVRNGIGVPAPLSSNSIT